MGTQDSKMIGFKYKVDIVEEQAIDLQKSADLLSKLEDEIKTALELSQKNIVARENVDKENSLPGSGLLYHEKKLHTDLEQLYIRMQQSTKQTIKRADEAKLGAINARKYYDYAMQQHSICQQKSTEESIATASDTKIMKINVHKAAEDREEIMHKSKKVMLHTDILRSLSPIVESDGNANKERIEKELKDSNDKRKSPKERLDTSLPNEYNEMWSITKRSPMALVRNKNNPSPKVSENEQELQRSFVASGTSNEAPEIFQILHQNLKENEEIKKYENKLTSGSNSAVPNENRPHPKLTETHSEEDEIPSNQCNEDKPILLGGLPRNPSTIYEDVPIFTATVAKHERSPNFGKPEKRARKVFDPSDDSAKKQSYMSWDNPLTGLVPRCIVCGQYSKNSFKELLVCRICFSRAHPNCVGYSNEFVKSSQDWTCQDCNYHCDICEMDNPVGKLIYCDECDRAYHKVPHPPILNEQLQGTFIYYGCRENSHDEHESCDHCSSWDHRLTNVSLWTVDTVASYFIKKGFAEFAQVCKEQDIDGTAFLLLTRNDVVTGLNMKMGPALKIYNQVKILQETNQSSL